MRGKRARQLRKFARERTVGKPYAEYAKASGYGSYGGSFIKLTFDCTRGVYQNLKTIYKQAPSGA